MRPKIMTSRSITRSLIYNEQKITQGRAELLTAANFLKQAHHLSYAEKLHCFERRVQLNDRVKTSQHITLNFDPADRLTNEQMQTIAQRYMQEIGFGQQPYLVYRHHDAGHPHCHIVTTHIRSDGTPIELYNIGRNQSEEARLRIEEEFHLVTTEQKQTQRLQQRVISSLHGHRDSPNPIEYGKSGLTRQISDVLDYVTKEYKYTSLKEFNLVLHQFNLEAYRGKENTQLYESRGLLYRVLNEQGSYIGVPLKASFFDSQPTLDNLEKQFIQNLRLKQEHRDHVRVTIAWELSNKYRDLDYIIDQLRDENIRMVRRHDKDGHCTSVHYIHRATNCIYTGEELGPKCDHRLIQSVMERDRQEQLEETQTQRHRLRHHF
ncbi:relaxase/mobilization nuclease domain-containing protein [Puia sp. P3]|uniref:relaxase/mobilization nuclease domain-containing protein n=1 Tax=Puia sp. P3 TaxID=3423952 RepID=UPI003D671F52